MGEYWSLFTTLSGSLAFHQLNLILLTEKLSWLSLRADDRRAVHIREVLKAKNGDEVDLGVRNGPRGKGKVKLHAEGGIELQVNWLPQHHNDLYPISLIVGVSRPQTCRKILDQATSMGVKEIFFFLADKSKSSYIQSSLWQTDEWMRKIEAGVEQAFGTFVPKCSHFDSLEEILDQLVLRKTTRFIVLDNYESEHALKADWLLGENSDLVMFVGPERGWSNEERSKLKSYKCKFFHLGSRVLRVETAIVAALGVLTSSLQN